MRRCNLAIKEGRLKFNPFSSVVPERRDEDTTPATRRR